MEISSVNNNNVTYTGLKAIKYSGSFLPRRNLKDAQSVKYFLDNKAMQKLFENYDVSAEFISTFMDSSHYFNQLYLSCQKIEPPIPTQKKTFIERIKSLFKVDTKYIDNKDINKKETLTIGIHGRDNNFHDKIKNTTWQDLEKALKFSREQLEKSQKDAEEIQKIIDETGNWI